MRVVFVFPLSDLGSVERRLARLSTSEQAHPWSFDALDEPELSPAIYADIDSTSDHGAPLYCDWDPADVAALEDALGRRPEWGVHCRVSGRVAGDVELRRLVLALLEDGGVAMDEYSSHCWTADEIASDRRVNGLSFFDYTAFDPPIEPRRPRFLALSGSARGIWERLRGSRK